MIIQMLTLTGNKFDSSAASSFIEAVFVQFDDDDIQYCVERNYQGYPNKLTGDVDIIVADGQIRRAVQVIHDIAKNLGWFCYVEHIWEKTAHLGFCMPIYPSRFVLVIELFSGARWHGIEYLSAFKILSHRLRHDITWKPLPAHQAIITSIHHLLYNGHIPSKYRQEIIFLVKTDPELFRRELSISLGRFIAKFTSESIISGNWDTLAEKALSYKLSLVLRNFKNPLTSIATILRGFIAKQNIPNGVVLFVCSDNKKQREEVCEALLNMADRWHIFIPPFRKIINCNTSSIFKANDIRLVYRISRYGGVVILGCDLSSDIDLKLSYPPYKIQCIGDECTVRAENKNFIINLKHFVNSVNDVEHITAQVWNFILMDRAHRNLRKCSNNYG